MHEQILAKRVSGGSRGGGRGADSRLTLLG